MGNSTFWLLRTFILDLVGVGWVIARFGFCAPSSFFWGGVVGWVGLLFHFILSKIVVKILVKITVVRGKICIGQ